MMAASVAEECTLKRSSNVTATNDRLLRKWQIVPHLIPVSRSTFDRWVSLGWFPRGFLLSPRVRVWWASDVEQWRQTCEWRQQ